MKHFLAVVPPIALATQIELFRAEWGQVDLPAHITAKAPNSLSAIEQWLPEVKDFCQNSSPLPIRLDGIGQFAPAVVYWRVVSPALVAFHQFLLAIIKPPLAEQAAFFEGPAYVPHLTLGHINGGLDVATLAVIHKRAVEQWAHPTDFVAQTIRVFRTSGPNHSYEVYLDLPLAGAQVTAG